jgi:CRISPR/Cas system-associated endonuclease Cas1
MAHLRVRSGHDDQSEAERWAHHNRIADVASYIHDHLDNRDQSKGCLSPIKWGARCAALDFRIWAQISQTAFAETFRNRRKERTPTVKLTTRRL